MSRTRILQILLIILALLLICLGILREESYVVLDKATRICLECIGIG